MRPKGGPEYCFNYRFKTNERAIADFEQDPPRLKTTRTRLVIARN
jgi:hypothetical protein